MSGILVEKRWVPIADDDTPMEGTLVRSRPEYGNRRGVITGYAPSGKWVFVKHGDEVKSYHKGDLLMRESVYATMIKEFQAYNGDPYGMDMVGGATNDPDMSRLNGLRYKMAQMQEEMARLQKKIARKRMSQQPQQQQRPQQQQPQQQAPQGQQMPQGFPALQQSVR